MTLCYNNWVKITPNAFVGAKPELVLKTVFGYDSFRLLQKDIITNVLKGCDTLAVMPTGGGKSLCYQIPALIFSGITIVVSPLISLMQDQTDSLRANGISAVFLNSTLAWKDYLEAVSDIKAGKIKIVYISPEGLATGKIRDLLTSPEVKIDCITIDEAHCVSEWGHDFRPDYMEIVQIRRLLPDAVMLALTATATAQVRTDIVKNLGLKNPKVLFSSFNRENIFLEVQPKRDALSQAIACIKRYSGESGIIYCHSRKQVDELTEKLDRMGYSVLNYHAGLDDKTRAKNQDLFIKDQVQIMVATVAFGMGIDKPNVRYVINYDLPKSLEEYYQEIGRAGRDGLPSSALLLYSPADIHKIRFFFNDAADPEKAEQLLQGMIKYATTKICRRKSLLAYFGEAWNPEGENAAVAGEGGGGETGSNAAPTTSGTGAPSKQAEESARLGAAKKCCCDICAAGEIPPVDVTIPAQKLLCCIIRTKQRFGAGYVVDVLLGSKSKRILENGHNKVSTWGIGTEYQKQDWMDFVDLLIAENLLQKTGDYNILEITDKGKAFLAARSELHLPFEPSFSPAGRLAFAKSNSFRDDRIVAQKPESGDALAQTILEQVKKWRARKAADLNVPPYIVFNDKTMLDLASKKPKSKGELLNVYGIGRVKADEFGRALIQIVSDAEAQQG